MEAMGQGAADHTAGRAVTPGLSAAALLRGRRLRSVPASASRTDCLTSDGGAAAGFGGMSSAPADGLRIAPRAANQDGHDGGAVADFGPTGVGTAGVGTAGVGTAGFAAAGGDAMTMGATDSLKRCLDLLGAAVESAPGELALAGFPAAAEFAGLAEEISRGAEYLQLLGAAAVDRTRTEAISAAGPASKAAGWTTGWGDDTESADAGSAAATAPAGTSAPTVSAGTGAPAVSAVAGTAAAGASSSAATSTSAAVPAVSPADDGSRNTAEFLRTRLRIGAGEARRRLALASAILPRTGITGQPMPPPYEKTAAALAPGT
ncbi:hypothetical protein J7I89_17345, partial [Arthrobacter sp. ISL-5]|nr:hypothetical protein [Arthrobacter sp. ISL-5]